jgi:hypothetical protein
MNEHTLHERPLYAQISYMHARLMRLLGLFQQAGSFFETLQRYASKTIYHRIFCSA